LAKPHVHPIKSTSPKIGPSQGTPGMAVRVIGLHGGAAHIGVVFEGKAMHLGMASGWGRKTW